MFSLFDFSVVFVTYRNFLHIGFFLQIGFQSPCGVTTFRHRDEVVAPCSGVKVVLRRGSSFSCNTNADPFSSLLLAVDCTWRRRLALTACA